MQPPRRGRGLLALKTSLHTVTFPDSPPERVGSDPHDALAIALLAEAISSGASPLED